MVFDYMEYDLAAILGLPEIASTLTPDHVKSWSRQLLEGCEHIHSNNIMHRDIKPSNILVNKIGQVKIADWGLARSFQDPSHVGTKQLTVTVQSLWYRAPELLLGCTTYDTKIDMWSTGCVISELFCSHSPLFGGKDEDEQQQAIFLSIGGPSRERWPNIDRQCPKWNNVACSNFRRHHQPGYPSNPESSLLRQICTIKRQHVKKTNRAFKLIFKLLELNPNSRWSAKEALSADYFEEAPVAKEPEELSMKFPLSCAHEMDCLKRARAKKDSKIKQTINGWLKRP